jgi:hypothetical protein
MMSKGLGSRWLNASILVAMLGACAGEDARDLGRPASAGNAGASGAGGAEGSPRPPRFQAVLSGSEVKLTALDPVWIESCEENPRLIQKVEDTWTTLRDERPQAVNLLQSAHYLDGVLDPACNLNEGCDVLACENLADMSAPIIALAREYVSVGQRRAPACGADGSGSFAAATPSDAGSDSGADSGTSDAGAEGRWVPNIESRAPTGPLRVRIRYYPDSGCRTSPTIVDVPVE